MKSSNDESSAQGIQSARRELFFGFCIFLGILLAAATGVVAYAAYQMQTARFGDIFDRVVLEETQTWVVPSLIVITGISIVGLLFSSGLHIFGQVTKCLTRCRR